MTDAPKPSPSAVTEEPFAFAVSAGLASYELFQSEYRAKMNAQERIKAGQTNIEVIPLYRRALSQPSPAGAEQPENHMAQIDKVIADLQAIRARWGNTCVYIRRFGFSWGAVALNRHAEDEKNGVFDLQARYEAMLLERAEQVERLIKDRDEWRQKVWDAEKSLAAAPAQPIDHRSDCQLLTIETYGLCTCDFDDRMRAVIKPASIAAGEDE